LADTNGVLALPGSRTKLPPAMGRSGRAWLELQHPMSMKEGFVTCPAGREDLA